MPSRLPNKGHCDGGFRESLYFPRNGGEVGGTWRLVVESYLAYTELRNPDLERSLEFRTRFFSLSEGARAGRSASDGGVAVLLRVPHTGQKPGHVRDRPEGEIGQALAAAGTDARVSPETY